MKTNFLSLKLILVLIIVLLSQNCGNRINEVELLSPDGKIKANFFLSEDGIAGYSIDYSKKRVIDTSFFGFDFQDEPPFKENFEIINSYTSSFDETWETVWGEQRFIRNNYNELKVELKEKGEREEDALLCSEFLMMELVSGLNFRIRKTLTMW
jgi:hypothetical protein